MVFSIDVTVSSHDLLRRGVTEARLPGSPHHHHRVVVDAPDLTEAMLTAAQMAASIPGVMVTGTYWRF
ncbi:MAG: hypothetical protein JWO67_6486 [Streptosporangiaceae bacterium]|nr:hypothetical protein [Streptosporangiaceae bacterium]